MLGLRQLDSDGVDLALSKRRCCQRQILNDNNWKSIYFHFFFKNPQKKIEINLNIFETYVFLPEKSISKTGM